MNFINSGIFSINCVEVLVPNPSIIFNLFIFSSLDKSSVKISGNSFNINSIRFSPNPLPNMLDAAAIVANEDFVICF